MLSCDQLKFCVEHLRPELVHGRDYWTGHPIDYDQTQTGDAYFTIWRCDATPPTKEEIDAIWPTLEHAFNISAQDFLARYKRKDLLEQADHLINRAIDQGSADLEARARTYRQALRDITRQAGYPLDINWPEPPS
jgi:hypothetical protein